MTYIKKYRPERTVIEWHGALVFVILNILLFSAVKFTSSQCGITWGSSLRWICQLFTLSLILMTVHSKMLWLHQTEETDVEETPWVRFWTRLQKKEPVHDILISICFCRVLKMFQFENLTDIKIQRRQWNKVSLRKSKPIQLQVMKMTEKCETLYTPKGR